MPLTTYLALLFLGLTGGVHCAAMCGGFVASAATVQWEPIRWHGRTQPQRFASVSSPALWMNLGRLSVYSLLGAIVGGVAVIGHALPVWIPVQAALFIAANAVLIVYGLGLMGRGAGIRHLEGAGMRLHQMVDRMLGRMALSGIAQRYAFGVVWGFVPCGLVYGALAIAALAGSPLEGALMMLSFGAGTLPALLGAQWVIQFFSAGAAWRTTAAWGRAARFTIGFVMLGFGMAGMARAAGIGSPQQFLQFCLSTIV